MKNVFSLASVCAFVLLISSLLFSCNKEDEPLPQSPEAINILAPDSSTIFADAGSIVDISLFLATDTIIDSLRAAYLIDTAQIASNLAFSQMDTIFFSMPFDVASNTHSVITSLTLPDSVINVRPFRPYFPEQQNPFFPARYDAIRVVFQMSTGKGIIEKQLKIIID